MYIKFNETEVVDISSYERKDYVLCLSSDDFVKIGDKKEYFNFYEKYCRKKEGEELWLIDPTLLPVTLKIIDNVIVEKTPEELLEENIITQKQYNDIILPSLYNELSILDEKAVRPLRAIMSGMGNDYDKEKLKEIEERAEEVRAKIKELENE